MNIYDYFSLENLGPAGSYFFRDEKVKLSLSDNYLKIVNLENAMKKGKSCIEYSISLYRSESNAKTVLSRFLKERTIRELIDFLESKFENKDIFQSSEEIKEHTVYRTVQKSVRIYSPFAAMKDTKKFQRIGHIVQGISAGQLISAEIQMELTDDYARDADDNYKKGRQENLHLLAEELTASPEGWWIVEEAGDNIKIACHQFKYLKIHKKQVINL